MFSVPRSATRARCRLLPLVAVVATVVVLVGLSVIAHPTAAGARTAENPTAAPPVVAG